MRRTARPHRVNTTHPRYKGTSYNRGGSIFFETNFQKYSEMVRIDTVPEARISVNRLDSEFKNAKQLKKKLRIIQVTTLAYNRAMILSKNPKSSVRERNESKQVAMTYKHELDHLTGLYKAQKKVITRKKTSKKP